MSDILDDLLVDMPDELPITSLPSSPVVPTTKFDVPAPVDVSKELTLMADADKIFDFSDTSLTPLQQLYIMALVNKGTKASACAIAGVSYNTVDKWIKDSKEFRDTLQSAANIICDVLEGEALRRAMTGSDKLLVTLLKANKPEKYADKITNVKHSGEIVHSWAELAEKADRIERDKLESEGKMVDTSYEIDDTDDVEVELDE